jgi:hypothetical protein
LRYGFRSVRQRPGSDDARRDSTRRRSAHSETVSSGSPCSRSVSRTAPTAASGTGFTARPSADRHAGPAQLWAIELAEARLERRPVDQSRQPRQRVAQVDLLIEARASEVIGGFGSSLVGCIAIAGFQHLVATIRRSAIFGNAQKSLTSNNLLIFQARLSKSRTCACEQLCERPVPSPIHIVCRVCCRRMPRLLPTDRRRGGAREPPRLIEHCYRDRKMLPLHWMGEVDRRAAQELAVS